MKLRCFWFPADGLLKWTLEPAADGWAQVVGRLWLDEDESDCCQYRSAIHNPSDVCHMPTHEASVASGDAFEL